MDINGNKTGLQPVSRPVEQIVGFHSKGLSAKMCSKNVKKAIGSKPVFQTSGHRIGEILPDF